MKNLRLVRWWIGLGVLYGLFLAMFALDSFDQGPLGYQLVGFGIHMIPSLLVWLVAWVGYRRTEWGVIGYVVLGVIGTLFFRTYLDIMVFLWVAGPMIVLVVMGWKITSTHAS